MENSKQQRIDAILRKCAVARANVGMKTPLDVGSTERAKQLEQEWLLEIKHIDPVQYKMLVPDLHELEMQEQKKSTE